MILFLTYHKVVAPPDGDPDFYTVSRDELARQLDALAAAGRSPMDVAALRTPGPPAAPQCFLSFDDGTPDHHQIVFPLLQQRGLRGVFFVPTARLNRSGYLSSAQVRELADAGHTIGCHSHDHQRMDVMSSEEIQRQLKTSQDILRDTIGVEPWIFAPPGGFTNAAVREAALRSGLRVTRTMRWGFNRQPDLTALETIPLNRHTREREFQKILEGRQSRLLYWGKEAAKAMVPARAYERLRGWVIGLAGKH